MSVLWKKISPSISSPGDEAVGGAVPCVVGDRVYLVGGSATRKNDPDIALGSCSRSSLSGDETTLQQQQQRQQQSLTHDVDVPNTTAAATIASNGVVVAASEQTARGASSQEGDVPTARIGHAAVVSPQSTIVLFGGEATVPPTHVNGQLLLHNKLSDVYEGTPKEPSGTVAWRALNGNATGSTILSTGEEKVNATATAAAAAAAAGGGGGGKGRGTVIAEPTMPCGAPGPRAFYASCSALIRSEWAMVVHGGVGNEEAGGLLEDLWAFRLIETTTGTNNSRTDDAHDDHGDNDSGISNKKADFSWEHLLPDGTGPPPSAYHSATSINGGNIVVFLGGRDWESCVFMLDAIELRWSSVPVAGLPARRLHTAISVVWVEAHSPVDGRKMDQDTLSSPSAGAAPDAPQHQDGPLAVPVPQLWGPMPIAPVEPNEAGKATTADDGEGKGEGGTGGGDNGHKHDDAPVFESILVFGGVGDGVVSGDATVLRADGTARPLPFPVGRRFAPPPSPRYNHAMVSINEGRQAYLLGGCRGDGTRLEESFLLDLTGTAGGGTGGGGAEEDEEGVMGDNKEDTPQADVTVKLNSGDVYTGQLDAEGRRQGRGRCEYFSVEGGGKDGGGGGGGSYSGEWDADQPHGIGERFYPARRRDDVGEEDDDTAVAAFGPGCPPLASYTGGWKRGVRHGSGVCTFAAIPPAGGATTSTIGSPKELTGGGGGCCKVSMSAAYFNTATVPKSYDGEWVDGRPLGRGTLFLRGKAVLGSVSALSGAVRGGGSDISSDSGGGRRSYPNGGSIDGVWAVEGGLIHGKETLPGKKGVYEGQYRLGKREGHGRLDLPDGSEYEGAWRNGRQNGTGTFRCGVTRHVYTGKWVGGVRCGRGICEYPSGSRYEGLWLDDMRHGHDVQNAPEKTGGESKAGVWHRDEFLPQFQPETVEGSSSCQENS